MPSSTSVTISTFSRPMVLLLLLTTLIGVHLGAEYHVRRDKTFVTTTVVRIEPKMPLIICTQWNVPLTPDLPPPVEHNKFIASEKAIAECIERYPELKTETSFSELTNKQVAATISHNFTVEQDREDPFIYALHYRSRIPNDGSLVLGRIAESYRKSLDIKHRKLTEKSVASHVAEHELEAKNVAAVQSEYEADRGYRFLILYLPQRMSISSPHDCSVRCLSGLQSPFCALPLRSRSLDYPSFVGQQT